MKFCILCAVVIGGLPASNAGTARGQSADILSKVDHLVYATPDLDRTLDTLERYLGVRATPGGRSPGRGTRNALISLGTASYLEIVAPDPREPQPSQPPWWMHDLREARIVQWSVKGTELEQLRANALKHGVPLGEVMSGSRLRPDSVLLTWRFTSPRTPIADGIVPFFMDWGTSPHPALSSVQGVRLVRLRAEHPDERRVRDMLGELGLDLQITRAPKPALIATLKGPRGTIELR